MNEQEIASLLEAYEHCLDREYQARFPDEKIPCNILGNEEWWALPIAEQLTYCRTCPECKICAEFRLLEEDIKSLEVTS